MVAFLMTDRSGPHQKEGQQDAPVCRADSKPCFRDLGYPPEALCQHLVVTPSSDPEGRARWPPSPRGAPGLLLPPWNSASPGQGQAASLYFPKAAPPPASIHDTWDSQSGITGALRGLGRWGTGSRRWAGQEGKLLVLHAQRQLLGAGDAVPPPAPFTPAPALLHKPRSPWRRLLQVTPGTALRHCGLGNARSRECAAGFFHPSHLHFPALLPHPPAPPCAVLPARSLPACLPVPRPRHACRPRPPRLATCNTTGLVSTTQFKCLIRSLGGRGVRFPQLLPLHLTNLTARLLQISFY